MTLDPLTRLVRHGLPPRWICTAATAAGLSLLYGLYALVVNPLVALPSVKHVPRQVVATVPPPPPENLRMAARHLPGHDWARDASIQLRTADAFVYAGDWEPDESGDAVRFWPFALIRLPPDGDPDEPPLTIVSESAWLRFESKFEPTINPDVGRIVAGALRGNVRIQGPDGLDILGRNFIYSEESLRIWSGSPVRFAYGPHRGQAHGLQIDLTGPDADAPPLAGRSLAVSGFRNVRLVKNVSMDLVHEPDAGPQPPDGPAERRGPVPIRVRSAGSFDYSVATHVATFEEAVRVYRPTGDDRFDTLQCDLLTLIFEPQDDAAEVEPGEGVPSPEAAAQPVAQAAPAVQPLGGNLALRQLRAQGRSVVLLSEENELAAHLNDLVYDAATRTATLTDREMVKVRQGKSELHAPAVTLVHDEENTVSAVTCTGPGWLRYHDAETGELQLAAQWNRRLRKSPDPETGLDLVELEERALVRHPERRSGMAADLIRLWLEPQPAEETGMQDPGSTGPSDRVRVRRMLALDNVAMLSPELQAETQRLDVHFEDAPGHPVFATAAAAERAPMVEDAGPEHAPRPPVRADDAGSRPSTVPADAPLVPVPSAALGVPPTRPAAHSTAGAFDARHAAPPAPAEEPPAAPQPDEPLHVVADRIRVRMLQGDGPREAHPADIWTDGNVVVTQEHADGEEPLRLTGDRMHLQNRGPDDQVVDLAGVPAHVRDRGAHIEGRAIHMDRARNVARVQGAGMLRRPVANTLEGRPLDKPQMLEVWWKERMTFDGRTASFYRDVRSVLGDSRMTCQEMHVWLTERVSFSEAQDRPEVEILGVQCKDRVSFDSRDYEDTRMVEVRTGEVASLTLNHQTGRTEAAGPGWIVSWRRGSGRRAALAPAATVQANRPLAADAAEWEYTRIDFAGRTAGNIQERHMTFHDDVQIVYGPVERPPMTIDIDELPREGAWMSCRSLRVTHHEKTEAQEAWSELFAKGNVRLEGRTFHAQADTVSYDESKGMYVLRGFGNHKAEVHRQKQAGGDYQAEARAQRIDFAPSRNYLKSSGAVNFNALD